MADANRFAGERRLGDRDFSGERWPPCAPGKLCARCGEGSGPSGESDESSDELDESEDDDDEPLDSVEPSEEELVELPDVALPPQESRDGSGRALLGPPRGDGAARATGDGSREGLASAPAATVGLEGATVVRSVNGSTAAGRSADPSVTPTRALCKIDAFATALPPPLSRVISLRGGLLRGVARPPAGRCEGAVGVPWPATSGLTSASTAALFGGE